MSRQSISITKPNDEWLKIQIEKEEYSSKSELVNDLIRQARKQNAQIEIIDMTGKIVALESVTIQTGANKIDLATDKLSRGIYTLKIAGENQLYTQKLIKQ